MAAAAALGGQQTLNRDENVFMARLAEQAERFDDMVKFMTNVALMGSELTDDESNLLSVAYKNYVGARRQAFRAVTYIEHREAAKGPVFSELIQRYRVRVDKELQEKCSELVRILHEELIPKASTPKSKVFYNKLKGDYHRYLAEFAAGEGHSRNASMAHDAYQLATDIAKTDLAPTHPYRLGLALNFSVFYYEVFSAPERACLLAKGAFDDAMLVMDKMTEDEYKDSTTIMQLLRDNLTLWTADMVQEDVSRKAVENAD
eukprot:TRINITY_DN113640_c0_g1_i1.p1 TRINITY_DN113640_c0_g1~~TRINITY_DN113640_c0_g1_i1.p1  ORF type:complete len:260 (-),score=53.58 TRINITY_DN113640_c0_g1_i1:175-954(-)